MAELVFEIGGNELKAELLDTPTTREVISALPIEAEVNRWGDELYFDVDIDADLEEDAVEYPEVGDVAYWFNGMAIAIFFGPTPMSKDERPKAADLVNVFAKINNGVDVLKSAKSGDVIKVYKKE